MRNYQESLNVIIAQLYPQGFEYTLQVPCLIFEGPQKLFCLFSAITKSSYSLFFLLFQLFVLPCPLRDFMSHIQSHNKTILPILFEPCSHDFFFLFHLIPFLLIPWFFCTTSYNCTTVLDIFIKWTLISSVMHQSK